jgi:hypothetical protein
MCPLTLCEHTMNMVRVDNLLGLFFKCILFFFFSFFRSYGFSCNFYTSCDCYPLSIFVEDLVEFYFLKFKFYYFAFLFHIMPYYEVVQMYYMDKRSMSKKYKSLCQKTMQKSFGNARITIISRLRTICIILFFG